MHQAEKWMEANAAEDTKSELRDEFETELEQMSAKINK